MNTMKLAYKSNPNIFIQDVQIYEDEIVVTRTTEISEATEYTQAEIEELIELFKDFGGFEIESVA